MQTMVTRGFNQVVGLTTGQHLTSALEVRADIHKAVNRVKIDVLAWRLFNPLVVNPELLPTNGC